MVKLWENIIITASEVCLVVYFLRLVSAPASPTTPGRRRQEGGGRGAGGGNGAGRGSGDAGGRKRQKVEQ